MAAPARASRRDRRRERRRRRRRPRARRSPAAAGGRTRRRAPGSPTSAEQRQRRAEAHGAALARLPSVTVSEIGCPKRSIANSADAPGRSDADHGAGGLRAADRPAVDRRDHVAEHGCRRPPPGCRERRTRRSRRSARAALPSSTPRYAWFAPGDAAPGDDASIPMTVPAPAAAAISAMNAEPDAQVAGAPKLRGQRARARGDARKGGAQQLRQRSRRHRLGEALAWRRRLGHGVGLRADQAATLRHPRARGRGLRAPVTGPKAFGSHLS